MKNVLKMPTREPAKPRFTISKCPFCQKNTRTIYTKQCVCCKKATPHCLTCRYCKVCGRKTIAV